jgi:hypothetical protein
MTQRNNTEKTFSPIGASGLEGVARTEIDDAIEASRRHLMNGIYSKVARPVRPWIKFVPAEQSTALIEYNKVIDSIAEHLDTTEARLKDIRESMTFTRAKNTIRRSGWYFTESYAPCGTDDKPLYGV